MHVYYRYLGLVMNVYMGNVQIQVTLLALPLGYLEGLLYVHFFIQFLSTFKHTCVCFWR
jgi:hypothetical protein